MLSLAEAKPGDHILDLGCAFGRDSAQLLKRGYAVTGIDMSTALLAKAKERLGDKVTFIEWICAN